VAGTIKQNVTVSMRTEGAQQAANDVKEVNLGVRNLGDNAAGAARGFSQMQKGLGGFVGAYAGAAATFFALQQAYSALKDSAKLEQSIQGTRTLAAALGESGDQVISTIKAITRGQLTLRDASESANLALASGFNADQIEKLTTVATKASRALGRDLGDSFTRLIRGATKLEPELLDELGLFTHLQQATQQYALQLGKSETYLTNFEKRQAFVNAITQEGMRKYESISIAGDTAATSIERLAASVVDLAQKMGGGLASAIAPFADFLSGSLANSLAAVGVIAGLAFSKAGQALGEFVHKGTDKINAMSDSLLKFAQAQSKATPQLQKNFADIAANYNQRAAGSSDAKSALLDQVVKQSGNIKDSDRRQLQQLAEANVKTQLAEMEKIVAKTNLPAGSANAMISFFAGSTQKEFQEHIDKALAAGGVGTSARGKVAGTLSPSAVAQLKSSGYSAFQDTAVVSNIKSQTAELGRFGSMVTTISNGMRIATTAVGNFIDKIAVIGGRFLVILTIVELVGSAFLKAFGIDDLFDNWIKGLGEIGQKFLGITLNSKELTKSLEGLADFSLNKMFTRDSIAPSATLDFRKSILGIFGYDSEETQATLSKKLTTMLKEAYKDSVKAVMEEKTLFTFAGIKFTGKDQNNNAFNLGAFNDSLDQSIKNFKSDFIPTTSEANKAAMAFVETLQELKRVGPGAVDILSTVALTTGEDRGDLLKYLDLANAKKTDKYTTRYAEMNIPTIEGQQRILDSYNTTHTDRMEQDTARKELQTRVSAQSFFAVLEEKAKKLDDTLTNAQTLSADGLSQQTVGLDNVKKKLEEQLRLWGQNPAATVLEGTNEEISQVILNLDKLNAKISSLRIRAEQGQLLLQTQLQMEKTFQRELNLAQGMSGLFGVNETIANFRKGGGGNYTPNDSRTNQLETLQQIIKTAGPDFMKNAGKGLIGEQQQTANMALKVIKGMYVSTSQDLFNMNKQLGLDIIKETQALEQHRLAMRKSEAQDEINIDTYIFNTLQDNAHQELKLKDLLIQKEQLLAKLAEARVQFEINRLNASKNMLEIQQQIADAFTQQKLNQIDRTGQQKAAGLQVAQDVMNGPMNNLFTDLQKSAQEIAIAENEYATTAATVAEQIKQINQQTDTKSRQLDIEVKIAQKQFEMVQIQAAADASRAQHEIEKIDIQNKLLQDEKVWKLSIFEQQKQIAAIERESTIARITADFDLRKLEFEILKQREELLEKEAKVLEANTEALGKILARDLAVVMFQNPSMITDDNVRNTVTQSNIMPPDAILLLQKVYEDQFKAQIRAIGESGKVAHGNVDKYGQLLDQNKDAGIAAANKQFEMTARLTDLEKQRLERGIIYQTELNNKTKNNLQLEIQAAGAKVADGQATLNEVIAQIDKQRELNKLSGENQKYELATKLLQAKNAVDRLRVLAEFSNSPFIRFMNDLAGIIKNDMSKGMNDLIDAFAQGTLTMETFTEGLKDWARTLLTDIMKSLAQRMIVEPLTNWITSQLSSLTMSIFGAGFGKQDISNAMTIGPDGKPAMSVVVSNLPGSSTASASTTTSGSDPSIRVGSDNGTGVYDSDSVGGGGVAQQAKEQTSKVEGTLSGFARGFGDWGIALTGSMASILAAGGDFQKALPGIFASVMAQILKDALSASSGSGVGGLGGMLGGGLSWLGNGLGNWLGGSAWDGMASGSALSSLSSDAALQMSMGSIWSSGGSIRKMAAGGPFGRDTIPSWLEPGEYVMRKSAVDSIGMNNLNRMNNHGSTGMGNNVSVNVTNQGTPQEVQGKPRVRFDGEKMVVDIILKDFNNNGPIRQTLRGNQF
jgi:hypothetical protein